MSAKFAVLNRYRISYAWYKTLTRLQNISHTKPKQFVPKNMSAVLKATALSTRYASKLVFFSRIEIEIEIESRSSLFERSLKRSKIAELRPFTMRSDSELLMYTFPSEKKMGLLMQIDFAESDGIKSDLRIRWPKSSDFGPKSENSNHRIIKSKNGSGL